MAVTGTRPDNLSNPQDLFAWLDKSLDPDTGLLKLRKAAALTANVASTIDGTYGTEESNVLTALRTRVVEIEAALVAAGILTAS
jgi:hypothetical protein